MPGEVSGSDACSDGAVEASFVVIEESSLGRISGLNTDANGNPVTGSGGGGGVTNVLHQSTEPMAPLSISRGPLPMSARPVTSTRQSSNSTMSIDQIRSSLMLHAAEINPDEFIEKLGEKSRVTLCVCACV